MKKEIAKLTPHPYNERVLPELSKEEYKALKNDIKRNGIRKPLDVNQDAQVLEGVHGRFRIARELSIEKVPVNEMEFESGAEEKRWIIKANLIRRQLDTKKKYLLYDELSKLNETGRGGDRRSEEFQKSKNSTFENDDVLKKTAKMVGVNRSTIANARKYVQTIKENPEFKKFNNPSSVLREARRREELEERKEKMEKKPDIKNLMHGDCLEKIHEVDDSSIDLVVSDPPYGSPNYGGDAGIGQSQELRELRGLSWTYYGEREIFEILEKLFEPLKSKLKSNALLLIFTNWRYFPPLLKVFKEAGFLEKNCLVWDKGEGIMRNPSTNFHQHYDFILFGHAGEARKLNTEELKPKGILKYNMVPGNIRKHPTEKPVDLLKHLIKICTVEGETIFDPFCGSGSTLIAAEELDRNWIGIEIDEKWYNVAKERILEERGKL